MLRNLTIRNYALIRELDLDFSEGLSIVTGETGAGKSILIGALSLILGQRADGSVLYDKSRKCVAEGQFDIQPYHLQAFFEAHDLDYDPKATVLRREIAPSGKSRAFVNDTPVNLSVLRELSDKLVNHHSQHETLDLFNARFYLMALDAFAGLAPLLSQYQAKYINYQSNLSKLERIQAVNKERDLDFLQFQLNELQEAKLLPNEQPELERELLLLRNAEKIKGALYEASSELSESDRSVNEKLRELSATIGSISEYADDIKSLSNRLDSSRIELEDIAAELSRIESATTLNPEQLEQTQDRLDLIYHLEQKHHKQSSDELLEVQESLEQKLRSFDDQSEEIKRLREITSKQKEELLPQIKELREGRMAKSRNFENTVNSTLRELGMPAAELKIEHHALGEGEFDEFGADSINFLFSANKGSEFQNIRKVASGGELSRLMLAIKSMIANTVSMPTLIFDEIDAGISGEVAGKVGDLLEHLSSTHQVLCITHRPQIAGKGTTHFYVYKDQEADQTVTRVRILDETQRVQEIAKMLSGEEPSSAALENARELLVKS